jgi:hypothetical protein
MQTKLTLRLDAALIRRAKAYAGRTGKSLSAIVADYFSSLGGSKGAERDELPPKVKAMVGALGRGKLTEEDYRSHLRKKHG